MLNRLASGKLVRMLAVIDESVRKCLTIRVDFRLISDGMLDILGGLFVLEGLPEHIRLGNGSGSVANALED